MTDKTGLHQQSKYGSCHLLCILYELEHREHAPNINNSYIFPPEVHQVPDITKDDDSNQDTSDTGVDDYYYSSYGGSCEDSSDTESE